MLEGKGEGGRGGGEEEEEERTRRRRGGGGGGVGGGGGGGGGGEEKRGRNIDSEQLYTHMVTLLLNRLCFQAMTYNVVSFPGSHKRTCE